MYPVSARFLEAMTGSHRAVVTATAVTTRQFVAAPVGGLNLPVLDGDVKLASTADVNGTLDLTVPGDYWDEVQPYGVEVHVARGVDYGDGTRELVPLGYYRIDDVQQDQAPYGPVRISGSDRSAQMQQNRVLSPYQVPAGTTHRAIFERLVNGRPGPTGAASQPGYGIGMFGDVAVPIVWASYDPDRAVVGSGLIVQDSTYDFLAKLADGRECVLRFDELGRLRVEYRDPDPDSPAAYTIEIGRTGTLIRASRRVTRDGVYNIVSAYGSDPAFPTGYSQAYNDDRSSPLYWKGPFGAAARFYASPVLKTAAQAAEAAATILGRSTGLPASHSLLAVPNPAVRPLDVMAARVGATVQRFVLDTAAIPLAGNTPVTIGTRTTNPVGTIVSTPDASPVPPPTDTGGLPTGSGDYANPAALHQMRVAKGGNHFNLGVGYKSGHKDITPAALEGGFSEPGYYYLNATKTAVVMSAPLDGGRTSANTNYARVEYREYDENGAKAAWNPSVGDHYLTGRTKVNSLAPNKPELVIAQTHDSSDDTSMIRFRNATTVEAKLGDTVVGNLTTSYVLGTEVRWKIQVTAGTIKWFWNDMSTPVFSRAFPGTAGQYFKFGCYNQSNLTYDSLPSKFEVEVGLDVECWHTGYAKPVKILPAPASGGGGGIGPDSIYRTIFEELSYEITSTAENSRLDWYSTAVYGYIQDIGDGRGYTAGIVGFCSATGDMLECVQRYNTLSPGNSLSGYTDALVTLANEGEGPSAGSRAVALLGSPFTSLWASLAVSDPLFRQAQRDMREASYWRPAFLQAVADGVGPLGLAILYDISINHGPGTDSQSFGGIVATARAAANPPSSGGSETTYLTKLIDARSAVLTAWGDNPPDGRVAMHRALLASGNLTLATPFSFSVYGDPYTISTRPDLPAEAARVGGVQPGTPSDGGTGGTGGGTGGGTTPPQTSGDGTQAAVALGWGAVVDGDEFEYTGSPGSKWSMYDGPGHGGNGRRSPSAFSVANGVMTCYGDSSGTTGGMAFERDEKYCRYEVRMRTYSTGSSGRAYHPVLITWPQSDRWPQDGENDFFETDVDSGELGWFLHIPGNDGSAQEGDSKPFDIENWHNYAFEWDSKGVRGWADGVQYFNYSNIHPPGPMHLTVQLDNFYGSGMRAAKLEIQWVRMYNRPA